MTGLSMKIIESGQDTVFGIRTKLCLLTEIRFIYILNHFFFSELFCFYTVMCERYSYKILFNVPN